jgi:hypothetical protein
VVVGIERFTDERQRHWRNNLQLSPIFMVCRTNTENPN